MSHDSTNEANRVYEEYDPNEANGVYAGYDANEEYDPNNPLIDFNFNGHAVNLPIRTFEDDPPMPPTPAPAQAFLDGNDGDNFPRPANNNPAWGGDIRFNSFTCVSDDRVELPALVRRMKVQTGCLRIGAILFPLRNDGLPWEGPDPTGRIPYYTPTSLVNERPRTNGQQGANTRRSSAQFVGYPPGGGNAQQHYAPFDGLLPESDNAGVGTAHLFNRVPPAQHLRRRHRSVYLAENRGQRDSGRSQGARRASYAPGTSLRRPQEGPDPLPYPGPVEECPVAIKMEDDESSSTTQGPITAAAYLNQRLAELLERTRLPDEQTPGDGGLPPR